MRVAAALFLAGAFAGCACSPQGPMDSGGEPACPAVRRGEAWVNRMPGTQKTERPLIVLVEFEGGRLLSLKPAVGPQTGNALSLEVVPGGSGYPGSAGYRAVTEALPEKVEIFCGGELQYTINEITMAR